jgi:hypothetical protein
MVMTDKEILAAMKEMLAEERKYTAAEIEAAQKETIQQVKVLLENGVEKQIRLLAEGHAQILARLPDAEEQGEIKARVTTLEHVTAEHTRQINELRQAQ